jgi:hypothetical protein
MTLTNQGYFDITTVSSNNEFRFSRNGNEQMRIDENGVVGIGTSDPSGSLDVLFDTSAGNRYLRTHYMSNNTPNDSGNGLRFSRRGDTSGWAFEYGFESSNLSKDWGGFGAYGDGNSTFHRWFIGQRFNNAVMYFTSGSSTYPGNVGIGTTTPEANWGLTIKKTATMGGSSDINIQSLSASLLITSISRCSRNYNNNRLRKYTFKMWGRFTWYYKNAYFKFW